MRKGNTDKVRRRSITLPDRFVAEMAEVREKIGAQSDSEVIRRAFKLFRRLVIDPDLEITVLDPKTGKETRIFII